MPLLLDIEETFTIPEFELAPQTAGLGSSHENGSYNKSAFYIPTSMKVSLPRLDCYGLS